MALRRTPDALTGSLRARNLGFVEGAERLRRLLVAWVNLLPEIGEPPTYLRIGRGIHDRSIELADDVLRRSLSLGTRNARQTDM